MDVSNLVTTLRTDDYQKLVEKQILYKLLAEKLQKENEKLVKEIHSLREEWEHMEEQLARTIAERDEAKDSYLLWFQKCQTLEAEMQDMKTLKDETEHKEL